MLSIDFRIVSGVIPFSRLYFWIDRRRFVSSMVRIESVILSAYMMTGPPRSGPPGRRSG